MKPLIQVQAVSQRFNTASGEFLALQNVSFDIVEGETISLIGHSGCGKSTLLNLIAGITTPTEGGLLCDNREIAGPGPERAVVFQNHSLLPWLSCFDNVALAVDQVFRRTMSKSERREWIEHNLARVQMGHALHKRPGEISGGMKQRVGIARALAMKPKVLLLDEPFGALDALTRAHLQDTVMHIQQELNTTIVMITHDVDEAVLLSDRVLMMTNGPAATVGEILAVDLPRPRHRVQLADDSRYHHLRQQILHFLYENSRKRRKEAVMTRRLVVIGNGMAATRLVQRLVERDPARFAITVVGDEPHPAYNRIQLSPLLAGEKRRRRSRCCRRSGTPGMGCACGLARRSMKSIFSNGGCASRKPGCRGMSWCSPPVRGPLSRRFRALIVRRLCPSAPWRAWNVFWRYPARRW